MENRKFVSKTTFAIMTFIYNLYRVVKTGSRGYCCMKTYGILTIQVVSILLISPVMSAEGFNLPGFQGYVLDKETGKPIENAHVVCFTDYYSLGQRLNLGGPNSRPDSIQIAKTDKNGFFIVEPYKKYAGGWIDYRQIYFFKEGYIYALQYLQLSDKKDVLRDNPSLYKPSKEIPLKGIATIYLSNKEQRDINGEVVINGFLSLLHRTRYYHDHFRNNNKAEFERLKPLFTEMLKIFNKFSDDIMTTYPEPHFVNNWEDELTWYRNSLKENNQ